MKKLLTLALIMTNFYAFGSPLSEQALKLVPGGSVAQEKVKEVRVKTANSSIVEVEFHKDGTFEEASGKNIEKDIFVPGQELLPLKAVVEALTKNGKTPTGEWSLEKSLLKGWTYEFEGYENGQKFEYVVDAKTGKLLASQVDD